MGGVVEALLSPVQGVWEATVKTVVVVVEAHLTQQVVQEVAPATAALAALVRHPARPRPVKLVAEAEAV